MHIAIIIVIWLHSSGLKHARRSIVNSQQFTSIGRGRTSTAWVVRRVSKHVIVHRLGTYLYTLSGESETPLARPSRSSSARPELGRVGAASVQRSSPAASSHVGGRSSSPLVPDTPPPAYFRSITDVRVDGSSLVRVEATQLDGHGSVSGPLDREPASRIPATRTTVVETSRVVATLPAQAVGDVESVALRSAGQNAPETTEVQPNPLPFFHARPIVPMPPGMEPLPPFSHTKFPYSPNRYPSDNQTKHWYFSTASVNPGMHRCSWDDFRPEIEAHRGLPSPHGSAWNRVDRAMPATLPSTRPLAPPPRPAVQEDGPHFWSVYVGRVPGVYFTV